jgi:hypothetical protein
MGRKLEGRNRNGLFFPGMADTLNQLATHCHLLVVTSNLTPIVTESLHANGVFCAEAVLGSDVEASKVKKVQSVMNQYPDNRCYYIAFVGDMLSHARRCIAGGRNRGWHSAGRPRAAPDHIVHSPEEGALSAEGGGSNKEDRCAQRLLVSGDGKTFLLRDDHRRPDGMR